MQSGTVKFFSAAKGFGFITLDESGKDVFVPVESVSSAGISALKAGQRVSFETKPDVKGPKAVSLRLIGPPQGATAAAEGVQKAPDHRPSTVLTLYIDPA